MAHATSEDSSHPHTANQQDQPPNLCAPDCAIRNPTWRHSSPRAAIGCPRNLTARWAAPQAGATDARPGSSRIVSSASARRLDPSARRTDAGDQASLRNAPPATYRHVPGLEQHLNGIRPGQDWFSLLGIDRDKHDHREINRLVNRLVDRVSSSRFPIRARSIIVVHISFVVGIDEAMPSIAIPSWREVLRHFPLFPAFPPATIDIRALTKQCPPYPMKQNHPARTPTSSAEPSLGIMG